MENSHKQKFDAVALILGVVGLGSNYASHRSK